MSTERVNISSDYALEGILTRRGRTCGAVICHPHPLYGGEMHNNVVEALEEGFTLSGFSALRFNFRGVGSSEGTYDEGEGEVRDVLAAWTHLRGVLDETARLVLAGYSFGAWCAARAASQVKGLEDLFLVAYPFSRYDAAPIRAFQGRLYFVGGSQDDISPLDQLMPVYEKLDGEKYLKVLPTSHFYPGMEDELRDFVRQIFGSTSSKG
jgi:uncharacterized protein